ncbi:hypothetical protein AHAS_Ahas01G0017200 [Arachis hypogaea]
MGGTERHRPLQRPPSRFAVLAIIAAPSPLAIRPLRTIAESSLATVPSLVIRSGADRRSTFPLAIRCDQNHLITLSFANAMASTGATSSLQCVHLHNRRRQKQLQRAEGTPGRGSKLLSAASSSSRLNSGASGVGVVWSPWSSVSSGRPGRRRRRSGTQAFLLSATEPLNPIPPTESSSFALRTPASRRRALRR